MEKVIWILSVGLSVLMNTGAAQSNSCHTGQGNCCSKCLPGFRLITTGTCGTCLKCPAGSYMDQTNSLPRCMKCRQCLGIFQYRTVCTSTTDAECVCIQGWKCVGENCERCTRDPCLEGQEPVGNQCVDCPYGTFKPGTDGNCRPWKSCSAEGGKVLSNGTRTSDVVCGGNVAPTTTRSTTVSSPTTEITTLGGPVEKAIGMAPVYIALFFAILFIIASILIAFASCKQWMKKMKNQFKKIPTQIVKTAEEEDGCSYHYPEEEQGDEELTQQP